MTRTRGNYEKLYKILDDLDGKEAKIGWFESDRTEDGKPIGGIMAVHEFGSVSAGRNHTTVIPPRPFFRTTEAKEKNNWRELALKGAKAILNGKETTISVMGKLALRAQGDVQKTIANILEPELAESTIAARRRRRADKNTTGNLTKPLVDTGLALDTLTSVVGDSNAG